MKNLFMLKSESNERKSWGWELGKILAWLVNFPKNYMHIHAHIHIMCFRIYVASGTIIFLFVLYPWHLWHVLYPRGLYLFWIFEC
jgi:hypothetical protein